PSLPSPLTPSQEQSRVEALGPPLEDVLQQLDASPTALDSRINRRQRILRVGKLRALIRNTFTVRPRLLPGASLIQRQAKLVPRLRRFRNHLYGFFQRRNRLRISPDSGQGHPKLQLRRADQRAFL